MSIHQADDVSELEAVKQMRNEEEYEEISHTQTISQGDAETGL